MNSSKTAADYTNIANLCQCDGQTFINWNCSEAYICNLTANNGYEILCKNNCPDGTKFDWEEKSPPNGLICSSSDHYCPRTTQTKCPKVIECIEIEITT